MSLNQSTSMASSRPSASQTLAQARAGGPGDRDSRQPSASRRIPGSTTRTTGPASQLLFQQDPTVLQRIQLALDGIHLSVDVLLGDVLVRLDLPAGPWSPEGQLALPPTAARLHSRPLPGAVPLFLADTGHASSRDQVLAHVQHGRGRTSGWGPPPQVGTTSHPHPVLLRDTSSSWGNGSLPRPLQRISPQEREGPTLRSSLSYASI